MALYKRHWSLHKHVRRWFEVSESVLSVEVYLYVFGCGGLSGDSESCDGRAVHLHEVKSLSRQRYADRCSRTGRTFRLLLTSSTQRASRRADGAHLGEVLNADSRSAVLNRLLALMKQANVRVQLKAAKNCQMHESYFFSSNPIFQIFTSQTNQ